MQVTVTVTTHKKTEEYQQVILSDCIINNNDNLWLALNYVDICHEKTKLTLTRQGEARRDKSEQHGMKWCVKRGRVSLHLRDYWQLSLPINWGRNAREEKTCYLHLILKRTWTIMNLHGKYPEVRQRPFFVWASDNYLRFAHVSSSIEIVFFTVICLFVCLFSYLLLLLFWFRYSYIELNQPKSHLIQFIATNSKLTHYLNYIWIVK